MGLPVPRVQAGQEAQKKYLDFLRVWLKDQEYVALAYMTGILPIKKYGSHSALNMFTEYSMTNPREMAEFSVLPKRKCAHYAQHTSAILKKRRRGMMAMNLSQWTERNPKIYSMYSPKSVVDAMLSGLYDNYWNQTETYEALKIYIQMNFDGLKDAIVRMACRGSCGNQYRDIFQRYDNVPELMMF